MFFHFPLSPACWKSLLMWVPPCAAGMPWEWEAFGRADQSSSQTTAQVQELRSIKEGQRQCHPHSSCGKSFLEREESRQGQRLDRESSAFGSWHWRHLGDVLQLWEATWSSKSSWGFVEGSNTGATAWGAVAKGCKRPCQCSSRGGGHIEKGGGRYGDQPTSLIDLLCEEVIACPFLMFLYLTLRWPRDGHQHWHIRQHWHQKSIHWLLCGLLSVAT